MGDLAVSVGVRFSDGSIAYLNNAAVTAGATGEEILTANAGGSLSQTSGIQIGQAYAGLVATHAFAICQEVGAATGQLLHAYFVSPSGAIMVPIEGGRTGYAGMKPLYRPVRMEPGVTVFGAAQIASDSATLVASASLCSPQKCDVFAVVAVDTTNTELVSIQTGATLGQSLNNCTVDYMFATYAGTTLNEAGAGVNAFFLTASDGKLKGLIPPETGASQSNMTSLPVTYPVRVLQNDGLFVNTDT
jgi:hypothetical protein